jgi:hypothetical protein
VSCAEDFDGNMVEAAYSSHDLPVMSDAEKEARRVLNWQEDVARSVSGDGGSQAGPGSLRRAETFPRVVERHTTTTESHRGTHRPEPTRSASGGISKGTVIGTLLGAAAGAAFAYAMVRSESPESADPQPTRAASYSHPAPASTYSHHRQEHVVERVPARSVASERKYASEEDIRPRYVERYTVVPSQAPRELETIAEGSYISTHSRARTHKPESHYERPLQILPAPTPRDRSPDTHVSRRSHKSSGSSEGRSRHSKKDKAASNSGHKEDGSYHSARSTHTESTIKPSKSPTTVYVAAPSHVSSKSKSKSKAGSRVDGGETVVKVSGSQVSVRPSQVALPESVIEGSRSGRKSRSGRSRVGGESAYNGGAERVELPESVIGGGAYEASVAPSDSVSSVGSKMERLRLVDRMRAR